MLEWDEPAGDVTHLFCAQEVAKVLLTKKAQELQYYKSKLLEVWQLACLGFCFIFVVFGDSCVPICRCGARHWSCAST